MNYDDLPCVFWIAKVKYGKNELRFEEYEKYLQEWNSYAYVTRCLVRSYILKK
jgi:hypothetical protein